jgi:hypothetical protein
VSNDPDNPAVHRKKPHCHPTFRFILEVVRADRSQNRNCSYLANERYRRTAPEKIIVRLEIDRFSTHMTISAIGFVIFIVSQIYYLGKNTPNTGWIKIWTQVSEENGQPCGDPRVAASVKTRCSAYQPLVPICGGACSGLTSTEPTAPHSVHLRCAEMSHQFQSGRSAIFSRRL